MHDENARALGGAAGHAGRFGTIDGVIDHAAALLDGSGASPAALTAMRARQHRHRTAGWERRFAGWPGGDLRSDETIGHTGIGLWIDVARGIAGRCSPTVHPTRHRDSGVLPCAVPPVMR